MKLTTIILTLSALTASLVYAHEGIELGPNKGRIIEFSTDETMHGEITLKDGKLHIALLDREMKPVKIAAHTLSATAGTRAKPQKLETTPDDAGFSLPTPGEDEWLILQYKETPETKTITARIQFNTDTCTPCSMPEWRCACSAKK